MTTEWQSAMEALILVATLGDPMMFARIGVMSDRCRSRFERCGCVASARVQRSGRARHAGRSRPHPVDRGHAVGAQLLGLVSTARRMRSSQLFDRRSRRHLRAWDTERAPPAWPERYDLR